MTASSRVLSLDGLKLFQMHEGASVDVLTDDVVVSTLIPLEALGFRGWRQDRGPRRSNECARPRAGQLTSRLRGRHSE